MLRNNLMKKLTHGYQTENPSHINTHTHTHTRTHTHTNTHHVHTPCTHNNTPSQTARLVQNLFFIAVCAEKAPESGPDSETNREPVKY